MFKGLPQKRMLSAATLLVAGIVAGVCFQKFIGLGAVLQKVGATQLKKKLAETVKAPPVIPAEERGKLALFILAGQSNMSGAGDLESITVKPDPRVYCFGNDYRWRAAKEPIDDNTNQVDPVSEDDGALVGPGLSFAVHLLEKSPELRIGLVPCAKSGSSISEWQRDLDESSLYGSCLKRALAASSMGEVKGILFFQGEADTVHPAHAAGPAPQPDRWSVLFTKWVEDMRDDLHKPDLPIVFAQIGSTKFSANKMTHWKVVQDQQAAISLPRVDMIRTEDLSLLDEIHFSTRSYETIGKRFAHAMSDLLVEPGHTARVTR